MVQFDFPIGLVPWLLACWCNCLDAWAGALCGCPGPATGGVGEGHAGRIQHAGERGDFLSTWSTLVAALKCRFMHGSLGMAQSINVWGFALLQEADMSSRLGLHTDLNFLQRLVPEQLREWDEALPGKVGGHARDEFPYKWL